MKLITFDNFHYNKKIFCKIHSILELTQLIYMNTICHATSRVETDQFNQDRLNDADIKMTGIYNYLGVGKREFHSLVAYYICSSLISLEDI